MRLKKLLIFALVCFAFSSTGYSIKEIKGRLAFYSSLRNEYLIPVKNTEKNIHQLMRRHHIPSFAIAIVDNQDILYQKAFGMSDIENGVEASTNTVFKLLSVSKVFTALEIFREVEEGLIDLDNTIYDYLPEFSIQSNFEINNPITIQSILAHRSGLPRNECVMIPDPERDISKLLKFETATADCYLAYPVGFRYKYSNLGYDLLGRIIEENRNMGYYQIMKEQVLNELGMYNSNFYREGIDSAKLAKGYEYNKGEYYPLIQYNIKSVPSGNLYSSIEDMSTFLKSIFKNEFFNMEETLSKMFVDHYSQKSDPETMGLGWKTTRLESELMAWHDGGPSEGIGALVAILPRLKLGIVLMGNSTTFSGSVSTPFAKELFSEILKSKNDFDVYSMKKQTDFIPNNALLKKYEGKYIVFGQVMEVTANKNKLKGKIGRIRLSLIPKSETEFNVSHWMDKIGLAKFFKSPVDFKKLSLEFINPDDGESDYMIINMDNNSYEVCPRYPTFEEFPESWMKVVGEYRMADRLPGNKVGEFNDANFSVFLNDNVLTMSGIFGPIIPLDINLLQIASGPFAGEYIEYLPESRSLVHQNAVFVGKNK